MIKAFGLLFIGFFIGKAIIYFFHKPILNFLDMTLGQIWPFKRRKP